MSAKSQTPGTRRIWVDAAEGRIGRAITRHCRAVMTTTLGAADVAVWTRIFDVADAQKALTRAKHAGFEGHWLMISSLAERRQQRWALPLPENWAHEPWPDDAYGRNKRAARQHLEEDVRGLITLLLPRLIGADMHGQPWRRWLQRTDSSPLPQQSATSAVTYRDVAVITGALSQQETLTTTVLQVGPRAPRNLMALASAFVQSAGLRPDAVGGVTEVLSAGHEVCDSRALHDLLPDLCLDDLEETFGRIGARCAQLAKDD